MRCATATALLLALALDSEAQQQPREVHTTIGMRVRIDELPLPGAQLRAKPVDDPQKAEAIVRVVNVFPHGSGWRYNLEVTPLVAGRLDLRKYLERVDGTSVDGLPEVSVVVEAVLPADQLQPNELDPEQPDWIGGYTLLMIGAGVLWVLGLFAIVFLGRRRGMDEAADTVRPRTLGERLRPLVERARAGQLDPAGHAELERLVLAHWRRRRNLDRIKVAEAISRLRRDEEAGPLLRQLEEWLHSPDSGRDVDVAALLAPYRDIPLAEPEPV